MAVDQNENRVRDNVRRAIEVMTAWTVDPDKQFTWSRFVQNVTEEPDGAVQMLMGFVTLGGELLVGLEKATGNKSRQSTHNHRLATPTKRAHLPARGSGDAGAAGASNNAGSATMTLGATSPTRVATNGVRYTVP